MPSIDVPDADHDSDEAVGDGGPEVSAPLDGRVSREVRRLVDDARGHMGAAGATAAAGTDVPDDVRLRSVKRAAVTAMRPVTSHQVPFNTELLIVVERLTSAIEMLAPVDAVTAEVDQRLQRVRAAVATLEIQVDDLEHARRTASDEVASVHTAFARLSDEVAELSRVVAIVRARDESARRPPVTRDAAAPRSADDPEREIVRRLAALVAPSVETVHGWARSLGEVVAEAPGPVLDLASGRGEWLDAWSDLGLEASGVDDDSSVEVLRSRGHDVAHADPVAHLEGRTAATLGAVTAASFADVHPLADVVRVVDAARAALRPGGVLVLAAAHPVDAPAGDPLWTDPRRCPVHPDLLVALAVDRGFAEVSATSVERIRDEGTRVYALIARTAGVPDSARR